ncbi:MAG TPA: YHS domain-containing (seleno)protein [Bosea sp. (in: a-proteobacteria)]|jgi:YHS domain-containing protein|uniref:YHS domain-containing (seleno)protein n=1 Tax=Bosea sp. (in: a-proteobacteria) TaxID=1871050 RepID=UPI002E13C9F0|nr:YHS domain-containing (seleno)protein [Bosea sp. (in: a-proteobacteria)]
MKAATRQQRLAMALCVLSALAVALPGAVFADTPGLPAGLPELPSLGESMQRDIHSGLALSGYDPIAYRLEKRAVAGQSDYELVHRGVVWRFVSAANREAFRDAPDVYEPAFAGFDASAVADGRAVDSDPRQFAIIDSRLFLFRTPENRRRFVEDAILLQMAEGNWRSVAQSIAR